mmetsp:Transcript_25022/g.62836  ORF Transcript_25022/g.62836 Transcript_25022/m.62836 type:complete len:247 (+) Transcript_25022:1586-2326(+)
MVTEAERLDKAQHLGGTPTHRSILERHVAQRTSLVDDVECTHRVATVGEQSAVALRHLLVEIGEEWQVERSAETALFPRRADPRQMAVDAVHRVGEKNSVFGLELCSHIAEGEQLGRAHERPIEGVGDENHVTATKLLQRVGLELAIGCNTFHGEFGSGVSDACKWRVRRRREPIALLFRCVEGGNLTITTLARGGNQRAVRAQSDDVCRLGRTLMKSFRVANQKKENQKCSEVNNRTHWYENTKS